MGHRAGPSDKGSKWQDSFGDGSRAVLRRGSGTAVDCLTQILVCLTILWAFKYPFDQLPFTFDTGSHCVACHQEPRLVHTDSSYREKPRRPRRSTVTELSISTESVKLSASKYPSSYPKPLVGILTMSGPGKGKAYTGGQAVGSWVNKLGFRRRL